MLAHGIVAGWKQPSPAAGAHSSWEFAVNSKSSAQKVPRVDFALLVVDEQCERARNAKHREKDDERFHAARCSPLLTDCSTVHVVANDDESWL